MPSLDDLDTRVKRIEQLIERAIVAGRKNPVGRKILAMLGLS